MNCIECDKELIIDNSGFYICTNCGLCGSKSFDRQKDYISFDRQKDYISFGNKFIDDKKNHYGDYILQSTPHISVKNLPLKYNKIKNRDLKRASKLSVETPENKKIVIIFKLMRRICNNLNINRFYQQCCYLFKKINKTTLLRKRESTLVDIAVSVIFIITRINKFPFRIDDFVRLGYKKKWIWNFYKDWCKIFNYKIQLPSLKLWIWRFLDFYLNDSEMKLKLRLFKNIYKICKKDKFWNLNPYILAISCFYLLIKKFKYIKISQKNIYENFGIQYISIWRYSKILKSITL